MLFMFTTVGFAQSAEASATADIAPLISIEVVTDLNFGNVIASGSSGTVIVTPTGARSRTGGVSFIPSMPGTVSAAQFTINGMPNATYSISIPNVNNVRITNLDNEYMDIRQLSINIGSQTPKLDLDGTQTLYIGATLRVNANQSPGLYTGTTVVTVAYN